MKELTLLQLCSWSTVCLVCGSDMADANAEEEPKTIGDLMVLGKIPPTHIAVLNEDHREVAKLLDDGASVDEVDDVGRTILWKAAKQGEYLIAKLLVDRGADINIASPGLGWAPVLCACGHSQAHTEILKLIVEKGGDVNFKDNNGWTPLMHAAMARNEKSVKFLVKQGANASETIVQGLIDTPHTPAMLARLSGSEKIAKYLEDVVAKSQTPAAAAS